MADFAELLEAAQLTALPASRVTKDLMTKANQVPINMIIQKKVGLGGLGRMAGACDCASMHACVHDCVIVCIFVKIYVSHAWNQRLGSHMMSGGLDIGAYPADACGSLLVNE